MKLESREATHATVCPHCHAEIKFYAYSGMGDICPHFYCDSCSNVYHNHRHNELLRKRGESEELLAEVQAQLPECPCGGRFRAGASPKCPSCGAEMPHQSNPLRRLSDPYAIQLEGASLCYEERTWQLVSHGWCK